MANEVFTAGVKPGGLTNSSEISILLCYLIKSVATPLTLAEIEAALLGEELVNYFELASALSRLCELGHVVVEENTYHITNSGRELSNTLAVDVPLSVRETALNAAIKAQQWGRKAAQHKATIEKAENGYLVTCSIVDLGSEVFSTKLYMPDKLSAQKVHDKFVLDGDNVYRCMLAVLTDNRQIIQNYFK